MTPEERAKLKAQTDAILSRVKAQGAYDRDKQSRPANSQAINDTVKFDAEQMDADSFRTRYGDSTYNQYFDRLGRPKPQQAKGGAIKKMAKGGSTASKRADGIAQKGKTKGRFV